MNVSLCVWETTLRENIIRLFNDGCCDLSKSLELDSHARMLAFLVDSVLLYWLYT